MSWKETLNGLGGANLTFLSEDGECLEFVVMADPIVIQGKFRGKETTRLCVPIVSDDGFTLFIIGIRLARRLAKYEKDFGSLAFEVIRHGASADVNTSYSLNVIGDETRVAELHAAAVNEFDAALLSDMVDAAKQVLVQ